MKRKRGEQQTTRERGERDEIITIPRSQKSAKKSAMEIVGVGTCRIRLMVVIISRFDSSFRHKTLL